MSLSKFDGIGSAANGWSSFEVGVGQISTCGVTISFHAWNNYRAGASKASWIAYGY